MIPSLLLLGLALGAVTPRFVPLPVTAASVAVISVAWALLVGSPWGAPVAALNTLAGVATGAALSALALKLLHPRT
ncbi:MAG: hypothetical protein IT303_05005 [Dehalococcoidia bacterium]|nr:hypothetical protein [Dehalococcoidia bacterium]